MRVKRQCPACLKTFIGKRLDSFFCTRPCSQRFYQFGKDVIGSIERTPENFELFRQYNIQQAALLEEEAKQAS